MALDGVDIRSWDLNTLLAAYEVLLQQSAKDEGAWIKTRRELYEEPAYMRKAQRGRRKVPPGTGMSMSSVNALLASDALYNGS